MHSSAPSLVCLVGGVLLSLPGFAADEKSSEGEHEEDVLEEIVVVGSRVRRSNLDSPSPVIVFDALQLKEAGITTVGEFARYLPQNSDLQTPGSPQFPGAAGFNLRGIGLDGTLTLLNGRRIAPFGSSGDLEPFVDVNAIPVAAIDRIEILTDGASAIYGSEAVAGVVNIVTLQTIEGITAEGGFLTTSEGDGHEWDLSLTGGWNNAATSVTGTLSWFDSDEIWNRDRNWSSSVDLRDQGGYDYGSSASSPPTVYLLESDIWLADPACPEESLTAHLVVYTPGVEEICSFNYWQFTTLQQPSDRLSMTSSLRHELSATTTFFAELLANRSETEFVAAPTVLLELFVPAYHPNNPYAEDLILEGRTLDTGNRIFNTESNTWRLVAGFEGHWGSWTWEAALMQGEAETDSTRFNAILSDPMQDALLGLGGPNGDQFYNPFGLNPQNPQEVIDQFSISGTHFVQTSLEQTVDFQISGKFGNLPGGPIGAAFGGQFRHQSTDQDADEEELTGVIVGSMEGFEPISESTDIYSVFAELVVPVLPSLEAQLAVRLDDYSDSGSTTNPKIGLGWKPVETLLLRATWGTSFRPPTFRELNEPSATFDDGVFNDPWRCPDPGTDTPELYDCSITLFTSESSGNPDLEPDEGETWLLGIAWAPGAASGFSVSVDYWSIVHENRIVTSDDRFLLEALPPDDNPFVIRAPQTAEDLALGLPGVIIGRLYTYFNGDKVTTDGVDLNLDYTWDAVGAGGFSGGLTYTYLDEYTTGYSFGQAQVENDVAGGRPWPQHRGDFHLSWSRGSHGAAAQVHYTGSFESPVNLVVDEVETATPFMVDDHWQLDLQYSYAFERLEGSTLRLGCRNCLGDDPPVYNYQVPGEFFHEGRGALPYVRWTQTFQ